MFRLMVWRTGERLVSGVLGGEAAAFADLAFQGAEDEAVDHDAHEHDDEHPGEEALGVAELAGELQADADRGGVADDDEQLAGHEAAPGEGPALLEAGDEAGQSGGDDDVAVEREAAGAHDLAGAHEQRRDLVGAGQQADGDRRRRAEHDDREDRRLAELEQQDRQREPRHARHRLQAGQERAGRGAQDLDPREHEAEADAGGQRDRVAEQRPLHGDRGGDGDVAREEVGPQPPEHGARARQHVLRPPAAQHDELPQPERERDGGELGPRGRPQRPAAARPLGGGRALGRGGLGVLGLGDGAQAGAQRVFDVRPVGHVDQDMSFGAGQGLRARARSQVAGELTLRHGGRPRAGGR